MEHSIELKKYRSLIYYKLKLRLDNCWISNLAKNFGKIEALILNIHPLKDSLNLLVSIKFEKFFHETEFNDYFEKHDNVYGYSYSHRDKTWIFMVNCNCTYHDNNYFNVPHFEIYPILQENEIRYLRVASLSGINIKKLEHGLSQHSCNPKIVQVSRYKKMLFDPINDLYPVIGINNHISLSDNEKRTIRQAFIEGYYDFPRKKNILEIAKKYKMPRSTYQFYIKKAESKIIKFFLKYSLESSKK